MKIDLNKYSINKKFIQDWYARNRNENVNNAISIWAASTHCPCICLAFYLCESEGFTPELIRIIDGLVAFYGYSEIEGQTLESPYLTNLNRDDISKSCK